MEPTSKEAGKCMAKKQSNIVVNLKPQEAINKMIGLYNQLYCKDGFDLLNSIHISENDHSRILINLLNSDREIMKSFVKDVLGIEKAPDNLKAFGQWAAIPYNKKDKNKGFIDILITDAKEPNSKGGIAIIIENKVCGADDMPY